MEIIATSDREMKLCQQKSKKVPPEVLFDLFPTNGIHEYEQQEERIEGARGNGGGMEGNIWYTPYKEGRCLMCKVTLDCDLPSVCIDLDCSILFDISLISRIFFARRLVKNNRILEGMFHCFLSMYYL